MTPLQAIMNSLFHIKLILSCISHHKADHDFAATVHKDMFVMK